MILRINLLDAEYIYNRPPPLLLLELSVFLSFKLAAYNYILLNKKMHSSSKCNPRTFPQISYLCTMLFYVKIKKKSELEIVTSS